MRVFLALAAFLVFGMGPLFAQGVPPAASVRSREVVARDLKMAEEKLVSLNQEEAKCMADLRAQSLLPTNLVELAGNDADLAAKMKRVQDLQAELKALQKEIYAKMQASPAIRQRQEQLSKPREQVLLIQKFKREWEGRRKALQAELQQLEKPGDAASK